MRQRLRAQKIEESRGALNDGLHRRVFGIENPQRIAVQASARVLIQRIRVSLKMGDQLGPVPGAFVGLSKAVDFKAPVAQAKFTPERGGHQNQLGIDFRPGESQCFRTDLVELAIAAPLRTFPTEHRAHVVKALGAIVEQVVFNDRADHTRRIFRPHAQVLTVTMLVRAVLKGIHLLFDDIGHLANAAHEQAGVLKDRGANIAIGMAVHQQADLVFKPLPTRRLRRKYVVHAFDGKQLFGFGDGRFLRPAGSHFFKHGIRQLQRRLACQSVFQCSFQRVPGTPGQCCRHAESVFSRHQ